MALLKTSTHKILNFAHFFVASLRLLPQSISIHFSHNQSSRLKLHRNSESYKSGFTLIEIIIVMSLIGILCSLSLFVSLDDYRGYSFRNSRDNLVSILYKARSQSINNICLGTCTNGASHGVHIDLTNKKYILFQGNTYVASDPTNESFDIENATVVTLTPNTFTDIIFNQLSSQVTNTGTITLTDISGHESAVTIGNEGQILWTN